MDEYLYELSITYYERPAYNHSELYKKATQNNEVWYDSDCELEFPNYYSDLDMIIQELNSDEFKIPKINN